MWHNGEKPKHLLGKRQLFRQHRRETRYLTEPKGRTYTARGHGVPLYHFEFDRRLSEFTDHRLYDSRDSINRSKIVVAIYRFSDGWLTVARIRINLGDHLAFPELQSYSLALLEFVPYFLSSPRWSTSGFDRRCTRGTERGSKDAS